MNKYYKPTEEDFTADLELELYDEDERSWLSCTLSIESRSAFLPLLKAGDIRVKYLNSLDFNLLGYRIRKEKIKEQAVIIDIIPQLDGTDKEIWGKEDIFDEHDLTILHKNIKVGIFRVNQPLDNVIIQGKKHSIKNLTELRKILK